MLLSAVLHQKKDEDIVHAYNFIHSVINDINIFRGNIKEYYDWFVLALMHLHSDMAIEIDEVCEAFIRKHKRKIFQSCILYQ